MTTKVSIPEEGVLHCGFTYFDHHPTSVELAATHHPDSTPAIFGSNSCTTSVLHDIPRGPPLSLFSRDFNTPIPLHKRIKDRWSMSGHTPAYRTISHHHCHRQPATLISIAPSLPHLHLIGNPHVLTSSIPLTPQEDHLHETFRSRCASLLQLAARQPGLLLVLLSTSLCLSSPPGLDLPPLRRTPGFF